MNKPQFIFKFTDEKFETEISRSELTKNLRAYRKHKAYRVRKTGTHRYLVCVLGSGTIGEFNTK